MENSSRYGTMIKQRRSGYEPSDTETEWQESPWHDHGTKNNQNLGLASEQVRSQSPLTHSRRHSGRLQAGGPPPVKGLVSSPVRRRQHSSRSPYKPSRRDDNRNISPFSKSDRRRQLSPFKDDRNSNNNDEVVTSNRYQQNPRVIDKSNFTRKSTSVPRIRPRDSNQKKVERTPSPLPRTLSRRERERETDGVSHTKSLSVGEINEMVANAKISRAPVGKNPNYLESTESISPGDIFFSRDYAALTMHNIMYPKNNNTSSHYQNHSNTKGTSSSAVLTQTTNSSSAVSKQSSNLSDASAKTNGSCKKFTDKRIKKQTEVWFSCIKNGYCRTSKKSPEKERPFDETLFIEKTFVLEHLRPFWADKHKPASLNGFTCHKQEAHQLKQFVTQEICPHILIKGPPGSGKKALTMALLRDIYGDPAWNISHDLRYFYIQETRPTQVIVPITSSVHHVELNVYLEPNSTYALMALVKQISNNHAITPEISTVNFKADYTVFVLYDVDKAGDNIQHLIKWIMDCYTDACKLILCCEDDANILEQVKNRCKIIKVEAPVTHEIMEVLIHVARKEDFELPMSFAAKIANKSKQNLRRAIMALEACKAHSYPFVDEQPIPIGWEEVLVELAADVLSNPSHNRLFFIRGKFQKLLVDFVHPKLILQKLVEEFLKGVEGRMKRELYYWHAYYDKRLPTGTSALLKLEEFVAKVMSVCRKASSSRQHM